MPYQPGAAIYHDGLNHAMPAMMTFKTPIDLKLCFDSMPAQPDEAATAVAMLYMTARTAKPICKSAPLRDPVTKVGYLSDNACILTRTHLATARMRT